VQDIFWKAATLAISSEMTDGAASLPRFSLSLLGRFELTGADGLVDLPNKKLAGLLTYLACTAPQPQSRDSLSALLWGSRFDAQARLNLRQALFRLRKVLGQDALETDGEIVSLNAAMIRCDVSRFEALVREGGRDALSAAADLYRGPLVDDIVISEEGWSEWLSGERERLQEIALGAIVRLGEQALAAGSAEYALKTGQRANALNNMREDAHRLIIQALAATGRKAEALKYYQDLIALLKRELNTEPDAATRSLVAELRNPQPSKSLPVKEIDGPTLPHPSPPPHLSIAVLPFANLSGDPEQEYFADGMVEEIITALSRFKLLFVIARNSSFTYKGKVVDIKQVGRELGVRYVLEGSVRKAGGKVRITGQLVDAVTGAHIWADRFERDLTDVFVLQDEVTVAVVSAIEPRLLQTETAISMQRRPENLTAHDYFLRAVQQSYLATREGLADAIRLANRALELDPRFSRAAALAGICHSQNVMLNYGTDPQFDRREAVRLSRLALSLDASDAATLASAAIISAFMVGDSESEIEMTERAVALNPNSFTAWIGRGWAYKIAGQPEEALRSFERAIRISPVDPRLLIVFAAIAQALIELGRFDEAIVAGKKVLRQDPSFSSAYRGLASAFAHLGRDSEARAAAARLLEVDPAFTISGWIARGGQSNARLVIEGLRKAGLPE
jgi:adenylate cyclase